MNIPQIEDTLAVKDDKISWEAYFLEYDPSLFVSGKKVTNEEFNKLFIGHTAQINYLTRTLRDLLKNHFKSVVGAQVKAIYNLKESYFKAFTEADWGTKASDDYYYITISADEHKHTASGKGINIDTELYLIDTDGKYYESPFIYTDVYNTVTLYTDTPLAGYAIIRTNSHATEYNANTIDAANVLYLPSVAKTGKFSDLIDIPNFAGDIAKNKARIDAIYDGEALIENVKLAEESDKAVRLTDDNLNNTPAKINNCLLSDLFMDPKASKLIVKEANHAVSADKLTTDLVNAKTAESADYAIEASRLIDLSSTGGSAIQIGKYRYEDIFDTEQDEPIVKKAKCAQSAETAKHADITSIKEKAYDINTIDTPGSGASVAGTLEGYWGFKYTKNGADGLRVYDFGIYAFEHEDYNDRTVIFTQPVQLNSTYNQEVRLQITVDYSASKTTIKCETRYFTPKQIQTTSDSVTIKSYTDWADYGTLIHLTFYKLPFQSIKE